MEVVPKERKCGCTFIRQDRLLVFVLFSKAQRKSLHNDSVHQEGITLVNTYTNRIGPSKYTKQILQNRMESHRAMW